MTERLGFKPRRGKKLSGTTRAPSRPTTVDFHLCFSDASGVVDRDIITAFQNQMLDCLEYYCATRYPDTPRRYGKILLRLPALRTVSARAADNFLNLSLHSQIKMNALVAEMMS